MVLGVGAGELVVGQTWAAAAKFETSVASAATMLLVIHLAIASFRFSRCLGCEGARFDCAWPPPCDCRYHALHRPLGDHQSPSVTLMSRTPTRAAAVMSEDDRRVGDAHQRCQSSARSFG